VSTATSIEWTEATWNPTTGCDRISPGCDHCYALTLAARLKAMGQAKYQHDGDPRTSGPGFGVTVHPEALLEPLRWRKPRKVFVDSMADVLHARVPTDFVARVWAVMALTPRHIYQVLTKRPERYVRVLDGPCGCGGGHLPGIHFRSLVQDHTRGLRPGREVDLMADWPLGNVWLGTSIESDDYVGRADALRAAPAAVRFLSLEPLLGPLPSLDLTGIDWVIVGGESGPEHRPLDLDWVREIRDRCVRLGIPLFFKQVGGRTPKAGGRLLDGRTWDQFPAPGVRTPTGEALSGRATANGQGAEVGS
jgi:protein gp37